MKSPAIARTSGRVCVPELRLKDLSTWRIEAAQVLDDSRVVTTQLRHWAALGEVAHHALSASEKDLRTTDGDLAECA